MAITAQTALQWSEQGYVPDKVIRHGIKRLLAERLIEIDHAQIDSDAEAAESGFRDLADAAEGVRVATGLDS